jgi:Tfp pilus assembly protein PilF
MRLLIAACLISFTIAPAIAQTARQHLDAMRHLRLGQENMHAEQWDNAKAEFQAAIRLEPRLEMAHYGLGQVYMATKRFPEAVNAYLACRGALASNMARRDDLTTKRRLDDQIQALEGEKSMLGTGAGNVIAANQFDIERRLADLRMRRFQGGQSKGAPAWISIALGSAYFRNGSMKDAEREYREALKADPKLGEAHNNLAVVYMSTGRYQDAQAEIEAAEKAAFKVNPQLKEDLKKASARR